MIYDLAIIGGGPAGYSAALEAVKYGKSVVIFEKSLLGGTCLNRGCVPTKFLASAASIYAQINESTRYGITVDRAQINYTETLHRKTEVVSKLRMGLEQLLIQKKISIISGTAKMIDNRHIMCNGNVYEANNILLATGSVPIESFVEGAITSDELLELDYIPKSMKIIGGGVVAVEFANIFSALGTKVTLMLRGERILHRWDKELAIGLAQSMKKHEITIRTRCEIEQMKEKDADIVLSAVGRAPNLEGLDTSFLEIGSDGGIVTDEYGLTKTFGIYAAGDVIERSSQLAHVGMEQGKRIVQHIAGVTVQKPAVIVNCIYTDPEIASIGLTEIEAKNLKINVLTAKQNMNSNARTLISTSERSFIKIVADADSHVILGAQLMCERASDIASELALAINNNLTIEDLKQSTRPHPSYCEAISDVIDVLEEKAR